jgi:hypothetical protein
VAIELKLTTPSAEGRDGCDADDGDEGHEQGVLHEGGATLGADLGLKVGGDEFVAVSIGGSFAFGASWCGVGRSLSQVG